jgi:uncharacterized membrane protein
MTPALALLFIGLLMIALGLRSREDHAWKVAAVGALLFGVSLALFTAPARAAEPPPEAEPEIYVVVKQTTLARAIELMQLQAAEIALLRERLKTASVPKECI